MTWGMLPLHASGVCACVQHFFFNAPDLEWLVATQGALTMAGNAGMCAAAAQLSSSSASPSLSVEAAAIATTTPPVSMNASTTTTTTTTSAAGVASGIGAAGAVGAVGGVGGATGAATAAGAWYNFDVEGFAPLWAEDDDAAFSTKIALLSLTVAAVVRAASLAAGPHFCDPGVGYNLDVAEAAAGAGAAGEWVWARGWIARVMVAVPLALNVAKWGYRQESVDDQHKPLEASPEEGAGVARRGGGGGVGRGGAEGDIAGGSGSTLTSATGAADDVGGTSTKKREETAVIR